MKKIPIYLRIASLILLIPLISVLLCSSVSDKYSIQSNTINLIQSREKRNTLSAYIKEDYEYSNYYNANTFYKIQQISSYWNYDSSQTNTIFLRYRKTNNIGIFSIKANDDSEIYSPLIVPLSKNPISRFNFKLLAGTEKKKIDSKCFESLYISESIADKLAHSLGYCSDNKIDNYNKLLSSQSITCNYKKFSSGNNYQSGSKSTTIAGIIDSSSFGIMKDYCGIDFVCCSWTSDLQLNINCPELIVLFSKDKVKNEIYLKELSFLNSKGSKWYYQFSDLDGEFLLGSIDGEIKNATNKINIASIIILILVLPCLPILLYSFRKEANTFRYLLFCGCLVSQLITILLISLSVFSVRVCINMWNSYLLLLIPVLIIIILWYKNNSNYMEISI